MPNRDGLWIPPTQRDRDRAALRIALRDFSFIDDPDRALDLIQNIIKAEATQIEAFIDFEDPKATDVAPFLVLAELWDGLIPVFAGGKITPEIRTMIDAVKLRNKLRMATFTAARGSPSIWAFPLVEHTGLDLPSTDPRQTGPQQREQVADRFRDWIDECLGEVFKSLTRFGRAEIVSIITELLDNAERHSGNQDEAGQWSTAGFMVSRPTKSGRDFIVSMSFLSLGRSISSSLQSASPTVQERLQNYVDRHKSAGFSNDALRTVVALQDYVTRVPAASDEQRGGTGFQDMIEFTNEIGDHDEVEKKPRIAIISGKTCIQMRHPHIRGVMRATDTGHGREIWFNHDNTPDNPPERSLVYDLKHEFPGTLISIRLHLDPEFLRCD